jgi:hypothetical protein
MDRQLRDLLDAAAGEPPHQVTTETVLRRAARRRAKYLAGTAVAVVAVVAVVTAGIRAPGHSPRPSAARQPPATVYVYTPAGTVTAIDPATNTHGKPVKVRGGLGAIAIAPDGQTASVASCHAGIRSGTVTPTGKYDMCQSMPQRPKEIPRAC